MADQTKKGVVQKVTPMMWNNEHSKDKYGNYKFRVILSDGNGIVEGTAGASDPNASQWALGKEVAYVERKWTSPDGTKSETFLSLPKTPYTRSGGGAPPKGAKQYKAELVLKAIDSATQIITLRSDVEVKEFPSYVLAAYKKGEELLNNIFNEQ